MTQAKPKRKRKVRRHKLTNGDRAIYNILLDEGIHPDGQLAEEVWPLLHKAFKAGQRSRR